MLNTIIQLFSFFAIYYIIIIITIIILQYAKNMNSLGEYLIYKCSEIDVIFVYFYLFLYISIINIITEINWWNVFDWIGNNELVVELNGAGINKCSSQLDYNIFYCIHISLLRLLHFLSCSVQITCVNESNSKPEKLIFQISLMIFNSLSIFFWKSILSSIVSY